MIKRIATSLFQTMSSYPLYYPMPKAILAYRDIISLFQGGLHTIITSVSEISESQPKHS